MRIVQYQVRKVERFIVTRYHNENLPSGMGTVGCESIGNFDNFAQAEHVAKTLAKDEEGAEYQAMPDPIA